MLKFFGSNDLNGQTYYISLLSKILRDYLTEKIQEFKGKICHKVSEECIIILESNESFNQFFSSSLKDFNIILFNSKNKEVESSELVKERKKLSGEIGKTRKLLKVIFYEDFVGVLYELEKLTINFHYKNGLPSKYKPNDVISIIFNSSNNNNLILRFHVFKDMDFPTFYPNLKDGFSIFMTKEEKKIYDKYKNNHVKIEKNIDSIEIKTQIPLSNFCQLCLINFSDYKHHVKIDAKHKENQEKRKDKFKRLDNIFSSIRDIPQKNNLNNQSSISTIDTLSISSNIRKDEYDYIIKRSDIKKKLNDQLSNINEKKVKAYPLSKYRNKNHFDKIVKNLEYLKLLI